MELKTQIMPLGNGMAILRISGGPEDFGTQLARIAEIDWAYMRNRDFVLALGKFVARFPKKRVRRTTKRPRPLYTFKP